MLLNSIKSIQLSCLIKREVMKSLSHEANRSTCIITQSARQNYRHFIDMVDQADQRLFRNIRYNTHHDIVLHELLPPASQNYELRTSSSGFRGGPNRLRPPSPFGRQTDAVAVLLISDNGNVLWRCHR